MNATSRLQTAQTVRASFLFFNDDSSECIVFERYRDSDALLEHFSNLGALMPAVFRVCSASGEILGAASPELRKALEGSPVRIYTPDQSS